MASGMRRRLYISHHAKVCGFNETETFDFQSTRGFLRPAGFLKTIDMKQDGKAKFGTLVVDQGHIYREKCSY